MSVPPAASRVGVPVVQRPRVRVAPRDESPTILSVTLCDVNDMKTETLFVPLKYVRALQSISHSKSSCDQFSCSYTLCAAQSDAYSSLRNKKKKIQHKS